MRHATNVPSDPNKQLEQIKIPIFSGNKLEFQQWFAAFSTCVDKTLLAPQFKMLRLEGYLCGEATKTIKVHMTQNFFFLFLVVGYL